MRRRSLVPPLRVTIAAAFFAALTVLSFWTWNPLDGFFAPAPLLLCIVCTVALERALRYQQLLLAVFVAQAGLAYSFASVRAVHEGTRVYGMTAWPRSVSWALLLAASFVALVTTTAVVLRSTPKRPELGSAPRRGAWGAALLLLAASLVEAVRFGGWTYYAGEANDSRSGGLRLELVYPYILTALLVVLWGAIVERRRVPRRAAVLRWALFAALLALEFVLQMRRLLITSVLLASLFVVRDRLQSRLTVRAPLRKLAFGALAALVLVGTFIGSTVWRKAAAEFDSGLSTAARLHILAANADAARETQVSDRVTYLGLDAAALEYYDSATPRVSLPTMALSAFVETLPGVFFSWKYGSDGIARVETCEVALASATTADDLPCTPEAEAVLAGGPLGVTFVGILWGAFVAMLTRMFRRPGFLPQLLAIVGFIRLSVIEASAFPMFHSLRNMAIIGAVVWLGANGVKLLRSRSRKRYFAVQTELS